MATKGDMDMNTNATYVVMITRTGRGKHNLSFASQREAGDFANGTLVGHSKADADKACDWWYRNHKISLSSKDTGGNYVVMTVASVTEKLGAPPNSHDDEIAEMWERHGRENAK